MKSSIYIKKHLLSDIILLLVIFGLTYLLVEVWNKDKTENNTAVELVPLNINPNDEIS